MDFVRILPFMTESSYSRLDRTKLQSSHLFGLTSWSDLIVKLFIKNVCGFYKYWKRLHIKNKKNYCQLCINYELNNIGEYLRKKEV